MNYILNYDMVLKKLKSFKHLKKQKSIKTRLGYEVPYYTYGHGKNHFIIVGGTHGSEIISVDFVLKLMGKSSTELLFEKDDVTIHFIPLQNPEGFIICTSVINSLIKDNMKLEEKEQICKEYYLKYKQDDINVINNPYDKNLKLHQEMFSNIDYNCIDKKHKLLRENVKNMYSNNKLPKGSLICYRSNGSGVELNRNTRFNMDIKNIKLNKNIYGTKRYNNILKTIPGPLGVPCMDINNFYYENENQFLYDLMDKLYDDKKYCGCFLYHGTGGEIYYEPIFESYESKLNDVEKEKRKNINLDIALKYSKFTEYNLMTNNDKNFNSFDGYIRTIYPSCILIELSKMGGNPIGPYGDIKNNYIKTIDSNMLAISKVIKYIISDTKFDKI